MYLHRYQTNKKCLSLFFYLSLFRFFYYSILFLIRQDRFFSLFKKKIVFYQSQLYASTLPRLQFTVKIRVCLSVSLFLCLSASLSFSPFLDVGLCFLLFYFVSLFLFVFFFSPYHLLFSTSFFICFLCRYSPYQSSLT